METKTVLSALPGTASNALRREIVDVTRWNAHFYANRLRRPEPKWNAPITLPEAVLRPMLRSLAQFALGDGGGPAQLIAWNADRFRRQTPATEALVDLWFEEEKEHARLLGDLVARFGGTVPRGHWSFSAFCATRRLFGVGFELTVLLLTEISSTAYYRLLRRHADDVAVRGVCRLILRDEAGHITFHRDRLAREEGRRYGLAWEMVFRALGMAAATMLWVNHAPGVCAVGGTTGEFYREVQWELTRFVRRLRGEMAVHAAARRDARYP